MSDTEEQPRWPKRTAAPSACVTCADNAADLELSPHRKAQVATRPPGADSALTVLAPGPGGEAGPKCTRKIHDVDVTASSTESDVEGPPRKKKGLQKARTVSQANGSAGDELTGLDGLLKDVQVIDIDEPAKRGRAERTQDIDVHFSALYPNSDGKKV
ncbi:hypothetical protein JVU11DRAFT_12314 [Chiua virens]|nr:hypothetical protein JVU11DRAFT_12314 [Chiua virens]